MNIHEMTPDQIRAHLKELEREEIRALDREIMAARGALAELEKKRASLTGQEFAPTQAAPESDEADTVRYSLEELVEKVSGVLEGQPHGIGSISDRAGISTGQARRALEHLTAEGRVIREGERRSTTYRLAPVSEVAADMENNWSNWAKASAEAEQPAEQPAEPAAEIDPFA